MSYFETDQALGLGADYTSSDQKTLARGIAEKVTGKTSGKAFDTASTAADFGLTQVRLAADYISKTQAGRVINAAGSAGAMAYGIVTKAQAGKYKADASGIASAAHDVDQFIGSMLAVGFAAGANPRVLNSIRSWTSVGTTCAVGGTAAITSAGVGAVAGGIACAMSAIAAVLGEVFGSVPPPRASYDQPRSIFVLSRDNKPSVATDAIRLAKVLRHHYGVQDWWSLYSKLNLTQFAWISGDPYPDRPPTADASGRVASPDRPIPAHNLGTILQMLCGQQFGWDSSRANINVRDCFAILSNYRTGVEPSGRPLYMRYMSDNDINVETIGNGAFFGRCAAATSSHTRVRARMSGGDNLKGWPGNKMFPYLSSVDFLPFVQVDELINFFAAITYVELAQYGRGYMADYRIGSHNPVRFMTVGDIQSSGKLGSVQGYSSKCITNLRRSTQPNACGELDSQAWGGGREALREVGALRLMSAFSYLQMMWQWSSDDTGKRKDPMVIHEANNITTVPVDPRQLIHHGNGNVSLRVDGGVKPDAPTTTSGGFRGKRTDPARQTEYVAVTTTNDVPFKVASMPSMSGADVYRDSNIDTERIGKAALEHNRIVERAITEAAKHAAPPMPSRAEVFQTILSPTFQSAYAQREENIAAKRDEIFKEFVRTTTPEKFRILDRAFKDVTGQSLLKKSTVQQQQGGAGGAMIIGAAALAALLLLR